jgi:hypothetical protein
MEALRMQACQWNGRVNCETLQICVITKKLDCVSLDELMRRGYWEPAGYWRDAALFQESEIV